MTLPDPFAVVLARFKASGDLTDDLTDAETHWVQCHLADFCLHWFDHQYGHLDLQEVTMVEEVEERTDLVFSAAFPEMTAAEIEALEPAEECPFTDIPKLLLVLGMTERYRRLI